jgi:hypothetical protein
MGAEGRGGAAGRATTADGAADGADGRETGAAAAADFITGGAMVPAGIRDVGGATAATGLVDVARRGDDSRGLAGSGQPKESGRFVVASTDAGFGLVAGCDGRAGIEGIGRTTPGIGRRACAAAAAERSLFISTFGTLSVASSESSDEPRSGDSMQRSQQKDVLESSDVARQVKREVKRGPRFRGARSCTIGTSRKAAWLLAPPPCLPPAGLTRGRRCPRTRRNTPDETRRACSPRRSRDA